MNSGDLDTGSFDGHKCDGQRVSCVFPFGLGIGSEPQRQGKGKKFRGPLNRFSRDFFLGVWPLCGNVRLFS